MFVQIFIFEIQNKLRRPLFYVYFFGVLIFSVFTFGKGMLPVGEKEHFNAPLLLAFAGAWGSIFMMLVTSSIMGTAIYKDIEYNTKDYYLTYPIAKSGYFFGRFFGAFFGVALIGVAFMLGAFLGTKLGPLLHWSDAERYGPNYLSYYLHPFLTIILPNLFFTSSLFFGLVATTRNVKVIYSGGLILFLLYFLSSFFLGHTANLTVINLADPFGFNGLRLQRGFATSETRNSSLTVITGPYLINRLLWPGIGLIILTYTYIRFNFELFFSGKQVPAKVVNFDVSANRHSIPDVQPSFKGKYNQLTLISLTKMEVLNIIRDNFFWIIISAGTIFLGIIFFMGLQNYGVPDQPRTVMLLEIFTDMFPLFVFFIIIFYTGEAVHRDKISRFSFINDSLPPLNWVLNGSKLITLLLLGGFMSFLPMLIGVFMQLIKGYTHLNLSLYLAEIGIIILPQFIEMVLFSYLIHILVNNKFAGHAVGIALWVAVYFIQQSGAFDYHILLYSYGPHFRVSDMDGLGHMVKPIIWFNIYWLFYGGLLVIIASLFYLRGVDSNFKSRVILAGQRFHLKTQLATVVILFCFLLIGGYLYYNVNFLNDYLTVNEQDERSVAYEKQLKKYADLPLPKVTRLKAIVELYPEEQKETTKAFLTIANKSDKPINILLLDKDELSDYSLTVNGKTVPYDCPLVFARGKFNWFRPKRDTSDFRLYHLTKPLLPGDTALVEMNSTIETRGFSNDLYSTHLLHNGTNLTVGLPAQGYDPGEEIQDKFKRRRYHLPPLQNKETRQDDPNGINNLQTGDSFNLLNYDIIIGTSGDQTALSQGQLVNEWKSGGRNYFHYVQNKPAMYAPVRILSARYSLLSDSVKISNGQVKQVSIYYDLKHKQNLSRLMAAYKDGLQYFSSVYGAYPYNDLRMAETGVWGNRNSAMTTLNTLSEITGWNASFKSPNDLDYCYFIAAKQVSQQWWRYQVAPNNTIGSEVISEGLAQYDALVLMAKKFSEGGIRHLLSNEMDSYVFWRTRSEGLEHPLITANQLFSWNTKAGLVMYALRDLAGDSTVNVALHEFRDKYYLKGKPPFAGSRDLYQCLQKHIPDSLQYFLDDSWNRLTFYDNRLINFTSIATGNGEEYKVTLTVSVGKVHIDNKGKDVPDKQMNDYIDIGVFSAENDLPGSKKPPLYFKKIKLVPGVHVFHLTVKGKPASAGIDPYHRLIDRVPFDNVKYL